MKELLNKEFGRDINNIYFIGIGGSSMSGIAHITKDQGFKVWGSDDHISNFTKQLEKYNIPILKNQKAEHITDDIDLIVYTAAIHEDNPEIIRAKELGIPLIERSDYLGLLSRVFNTTIGVAGTHGKTTTSSMIAHILEKGELQPTVSIGAYLDSLGSNAQLGNSEYFIVESCEFVDSFLKTQHEIGVITNIEKDHLDYFKGGLKQIKDSFHEFGMIIPKTGLMVACGDEKNVREVTEGLRCPVIYYGLDEEYCSWVAKNIVYNDYGNPTYDVYQDGNYYGTFSLEVPGAHNIKNSLAAIIIGNYVGLDEETIAKALKNFKGAARRFQFDGVVNEIHVYEDYAHHPTEIAVTIDSALNHKHNNFWIVFQPHSYSRTKDLFDDFVDSFERADKLILNDIYSDREDNKDYHIYSEDLAKIIKEKYNIPTIVMKEFDSIVDFMSNNLEKGDLVLVVGAGNITDVAGLLVKRLKEDYKDLEENE